MKHFIIFLYLFFVGQLLFGQSKVITKENLLFEKGFTLQELVDDDLDLDDIINSNDSNKSKKEFATDIKETILEKSLKYYNELIDSFPKSNLLFRALNNKGVIELALDDNIEAKKTFKRILESTADDKEKGGTGSGIMAEPYANYKNRASKILADICIADSNFKEAISYLELTKKYPYRHFCGNEYASNRINMCVKYAKCYVGLNDNKKAIEILLPELLENGLAGNSNVVELAYSVLTKEYSKKDLKSKYETAFKNYKIEKAKNKNEDSDRYYIEFLDTKLYINSWRLEFKKQEEKEKMIDEICKKSKFYKLLNE